MRKRFLSCSLSVAVLSNQLLFECTVSTSYTASMYWRQKFATLAVIMRVKYQAVCGSTVHSAMGVLPVGRMTRFRRSNERGLLIAFGLLLLTSLLQSHRPRPDCTHPYLRIVTALGLYLSFSSSYRALADRFLLHYPNWTYHNNHALCSFLILILQLLPFLLPALTVLLFNIHLLLLISSQTPLQNNPQKKPFPIFLFSTIA